MKNTGSATVHCAVSHTPIQISNAAEQIMPCLCITIWAQKLATLIKSAPNLIKNPNPQKFSPAVAGGQFSILY